jgi:hypothetical protein
MAAAGAAAGAAAASPGAGDRRDSKSAGNAQTTSVTTTADSLLESRIAAIVEKRLAALAAVNALPKTPAKPKAITNARMGDGILAQLRANARLSDDDADDADRVSDIDNSDDDREPATPVAGAAAAAAAAAADAAAAGAASGAVARRGTNGRARARIAADMLRNCVPYGSVTAWVKQNDWKSGRNKHECEALARAVDALLAEGTPVKSTGIEILMRRLSGVHLADQHSEWQLADSVAWNPLGNSLLPRAEVTRALKEADQLKRLTSNMSNGGYRYKRDTTRAPRDDRRDGRPSGNSKTAWPAKKAAATKTAPTPGTKGAADSQ